MSRKYLNNRLPIDTGLSKVGVIRPTIDYPSDPGRDLIKKILSEIEANKNKPEEQPDDKKSNNCVTCKWKYQILSEKMISNDLITTLNLMGDNGWELIDVLKREAGEYWIFKQPLSS